MDFGKSRIVVVSFLEFVGYWQGEILDIEPHRSVLVVGNDYDGVWKCLQRAEVIDQAAKRLVFGSSHLAV